LLPEITVEGDCLIFVWALPAGRIKAEVDEVHRETAGLHAEITWSNADETVEAPLLAARSRVNLSSISTRRTVANYMGDKTKPLEGKGEDEIPWLTMLEQIAHEADKHERKGEPFVEIGGAGEVPARRWRLEKLLEEEQVTIIFGEGESGKTTLADAIALSVQGWAPIIGLTPEIGNVLYLDWETSREEHEARLRLLAKGFGMFECPLIFYRRMSAPLVKEIRTIRRFVAKNDIKLVIIDSVGMAMGEKPKEGDPVIPLFTAIRSLGVTTLCIDHISKADMQTKEGRHPYGSVYKWNIARSVWEMRSTKDSTGEINVALYHQKSNNGAHERALGYRIVFKEGATYVKRSDVADTPELAEGLKNWERVRAELRHGRRTVLMLCEATGIAEQTLRVTLGRGQKTGLFERDDQGFWGLPASVALSEAET